MCIKSSLSSIIPKNLQAGYNMANPQLPLSELAGRDLTVCVSVLTGSQCAEKLVASGVEPKVVVATNVNPKLVGECVLDRHIGWVSVYEHNMVELTRSRVTVVDLAVGGVS
ncbi:unnamed protein product [Brassica rapa]|uniref:Uncharacterized protein n=1 Tax=Brassica campestris TaxID=3711 RepID=A0A3P6D8T4_BRACM|nr:unnamed protein product [Brassica rapa]VDD16942.1 unnamed protein product [Brassica rapa]